MRDPVTLSFHFRQKRTCKLQDTPCEDEGHVTPRPLPHAGDEDPEGSNSEADAEEDVDALIRVVA